MGSVKFCSGRSQGSGGSNNYGRIVDIKTPEKIQEAKRRACSICFFVVSPGDPDKEEIDGKIYHGACLTKTKT